MTMAYTDFKKLRVQMVSRQIAQRGIDNPEILKAFSIVYRHLFVSKSQRRFAYDDCPLPIGEGQTISQPYIVALMTKFLEIKPNMRVLEIGTGSGYQAAILSFLGAKVYTMEYIESLAQKAQNLLVSLGYTVKIKVGDGSLGWPKNSPYERIIVTAGAPCLPQSLIAQLAVGGRLVIPVGGKFTQDLVVIYKVSKSQIKEENICGCRFVPLVGRYGWN